MSRPLINNKYRITKRVGGGSFGDIYLGVGANGEKVAVKFEKHGARCPQLRHEYKVYRELQNAPGFAKVHYFGTQDSYNLMVMDLLGPSLEDQFNKCNRRFTLKTVLMIADQMLERVELMHSRHLIHRDIKPANFTTDVGGAAGTSVYCIDFGLSKRYRHPRTLQHIPQREGRSLTGTPRYASINNHQGVEQSRRDDLESIGYVLVYFLRGSLPWQGLKAKSASKKYKLIMEKKQSSSIPQLCQGCPNQFAEYLAYCRHLKFEAKPNIAFLRGIFRDLFRSQGYTNNNSTLDWDWNRVDNQGPEPMLGSAGGGDDNDEGEDGINQMQMMNNNNDKRPDTAAAVGRPDTAAAIRPNTTSELGEEGKRDRGSSNGARRVVATPSSNYFDLNETNGLSSNGNGYGNGGGYQYPDGSTNRSATNEKSSYSIPERDGKQRGNYSSLAGSNGNSGTYTGSRAQPNFPIARPSTASRVNTSSMPMQASAASGGGNRPSTAYGPRSGNNNNNNTSSSNNNGITSTSRMPSQHHQQQQTSSSTKQPVVRGEHAVAGARGMMAYRKARVDSSQQQIDQKPGIAWRQDNSGSGGGGRLPSSSSGGNTNSNYNNNTNSSSTGMSNPPKSLLQRKPEPAWDTRPSNSSTNAAQASSQGSKPAFSFKYDGRVNGGGGSGSGGGSGNASKEQQMQQQGKMPKPLSGRR